MKYLVSLIMILVASLWGASRWLEQEPVIIPELVEVVDVKAPGPWETFVNPKTGLAYVNGGDTIQCATRPRRNRHPRNLDSRCHSRYGYR